MPTRTLFPDGSLGHKPGSSKPGPGEAFMPVSDLLAAFILERGRALPDEWQVDNGVADLHPDIRWCPGDRIPSE